MKSSSPGYFTRVYKLMVTMFHSLFGYIFETVPVYHRPSTRVPWKGVNRDYPIASPGIWNDGGAINIEREDNSWS